MKLFKTSKFPALAFYLEDQRFKFAGGKLAVEDEVAEGVRQFAAARPQYEIMEVDGDYQPEPNPLTAPDKDAQKAGEVGGIVGVLTSPRKEDNPQVVTDPVPGGQEVTESADLVADDASDAVDADATPEGPEDPEEIDNGFDEAAAREYFNAMKNADIRKALEDEGQNVSGNHQELVDRAVAYAAEKYAADKAALDAADGEASEA